MDVCLSCVLCVLRRADRSSGGALQTGVSECDLEASTVRRPSPTAIVVEG